MSTDQKDNILDIENISNADIKAKWGLPDDIDPYSVDIDKINPANNDWFGKNLDIDVFKRLREESPVHFTEDSQAGPYWSISGYEDVKAIDMNHKTFSSDIMNGGIRLGGQPMSEPPDAIFHLPMFIMQDQPIHTDQRQVVAPMFTPGHLGNFEQLIRERTESILDELPDGETFNWVDKVSIELTSRMLATLFDVPQEDRLKLIHWSDTVERITDPDFFETPEEGFQELWKCFEYFNSIWEERKANGSDGNDLISMLAQGENSKNMTPYEFLGNVILLIVAGNDTTRNSMSGGIKAFNQFPEQLAKVQANNDLIGLSGSLMGANLLKSDNATIAANEDQARRIAGFFKYPNHPIKITEDTTSFKLELSTKNSVSIDMAVDGSDVIWGAKMGADPFTIRVVTGEAS